MLKFLVPMPPRRKVEREHEKETFCIALGKQRSKFSIKFHEVCSTEK